MSVPSINAKTFANVNSEASNAIGRVFSQYLERGSNTADVFSKFEGADGAMGFPVCRKTDLTKGAGKKVTFTIKGELSGFGKLGEQTLLGNEEKRRYGTKDVEIDFIRHAEGYTRKQIEFMAAGRGVKAEMADDLAMWWGRKKQTAVLDRLRKKAVNGTNVFCAGGAGSIAVMTASNIMSVSTIQQACSFAGQIGAKPIRLGKSNAGAPINKYMVFGPDQVLLPLKSNSTYLASLQYAQQRGYGNNELFDGGIADVDGNTIFHWMTVDPDTDGPIGSMFDPRAKLRTAITAGSSQIDITAGPGSTSTSALYFEYFPGYAWLHFEEESISSDSNVYYIVIWNHTESTGGAGDQGKWGFYSYTGTDNNGNKLTTTARLGAGGAGHAPSTLAGVTWSSTYNTEAHPAGAPIFLANRLGKVYGYAAVLGSNAVMRAYGGGAFGDAGSSVAGKIKQNDQDYEMLQGSAIEAVAGCDVWCDTQGAPRNYVLVPAVYTPNGTTL